MSSLVRICVVLLLLGQATTASAQIAATFTGRVTDTNGDPLTDVNVFIAASMIGAVTDENGRFEIRGIPLGTLRLYVSRIGYESVYEDIFVRGAESYSFNFTLKEAVYELGELTVTEDNRRWQQQLERFTRLFIGETAWARRTTIMNPEVLDFSDRRGESRAQASEPLIIENRALGYKLTYFLNEFVAHPTGWRWDGEPLFQPLEPESPEEAAMWNARRDSAFFGSFRHFLLAVINDQVEGEGFKIYSRDDPRSTPLGAGSLGGALRSSGVPGLLQGNQRFSLFAADIMKPGEAAIERILDFEGFVEIVYTREVEDKAYLRLEGKPFQRPKFQTSMIKLDKGPTIVDLKGDTLDPYGVTFYGGYFGYERVANQMPKEYRPWID